MTASASPPPRAFVLGNFVQACCWQVARLPAPGETLQAHGFHKEAGGKGLNVAVGLQRLGARVQTLIGCGQDARPTRCWRCWPPRAWMPRTCIACPAPRAGAQG